MTQVLLGIIGFSSGVVIAGGLISFIIGLGVISQFADRTHTGDKILLYEECTALGGILGNLMYIYHIRIPYGEFLVPLFGIFGGIFVGCWAMALAEILNIFPIFIRRAKILKAIPYLMVGFALGKGLGGLLYFWQRW